MPLSITTMMMRMAMRMMMTMSFTSSRWTPPQHETADDVIKHIQLLFVETPEPFEEKLAEQGVDDVIEELNQLALNAPQHHTNEDVDDVDVAIHQFALDAPQLDAADDVLEDIQLLFLDMPEPFELNLNLFLHIDNG